MLPDAALYRLLSWLSPSFPVGSYSYSHGIEAAVELGLVGDAEGLTEWIEAILLHGAGRIDASLFRFAWEAVRDGDEAAFAAAAERAAVMRGTAETALESRAQGRAFLDTVAAAWPAPVLRRWADVVRDMGVAPAYSVSVALCAAVADVPLRPALAAFVHAAAANLISAGVRLIPLGQTDGQRVLAGLEPAVADTVTGALTRPLADLGSATPIVDWTSMLHETQYTRLFRS